MRSVFIVIVFLLLLLLIVTYADAVWYLNNELFDCENVRVEEVPDLSGTPTDQDLAVHCKKAYELYCNPSNADTWVPKGCDVLVTFSDEAGYVLRNKAANNVAIVFRGTYNASDVALDSSVSQVACPYATGRVHEGFLTLYEELRPAIVHAFATHDLSSAHVYVTGHSLGAAVACLCAMDLEQQRLPRKAVVFASPKLGDDALMQSTFAGFAVYRNLADVVPLSPPGTDEMLWFDFPKGVVKLFMDERGSWIKNHSIDNYIKFAQN